MDITFTYFLEQMSENPIFLISALLTLGVILVNGWTDAPNAIATCVGTRCMNPQPAIFMAAIFNFFGVFIMTMLSPKVAVTISNMVNFGGNSKDALIALCAAMVAIVIWAVAAWAFGIPTSESHALIAGLSGAAIALQGGIDGINKAEWIKVLYGLVLSTVIGFGLGYLVCKLVAFLFRKANRRKVEPFFEKAQIFGAAFTAFMHGAQDGQKFMGVLILGMFLSQGRDSVGNIMPPLWMMILCSVVMGLGTSIGGKKIIKSVGMDMVKLEKYQGFSADIAASLSLLISTLFGIPVSTTHTKTTAIMGVGAVKRLSTINMKVVQEMVLTWLLTFPGCGLIGYIIAKLFIQLF